MVLIENQSEHNLAGGLKNKQPPNISKKEERKKGVNKEYRRVKQQRWCKSSKTNCTSRHYSSLFIDFTEDSPTNLLYLKSNPLASPAAFHHHFC